MGNVDECLAKLSYCNYLLKMFPRGRGTLCGIKIFLIQLCQFGDRKMGFTVLVQTAVRVGKGRKGKQDIRVIISHSND